MQNYIKRIKQNNDHTRIVRKIPFPSSYKIWRLNHTAQKMIWIWPYLLQKWVMESFSFFAVSCIQLIDWYNSWAYSLNPIFSQCSHFIYLLKTLSCQDVGIVISLREIRGQLIIRKMYSSPSELVVFFKRGETIRSNARHQVNRYILILKDFAWWSTYLWPTVTGWTFAMMLVCFHAEVWFQYAANLQENTHTEVWFQ